jgi:hypothetical protein
MRRGLQMVLRRGERSLIRRRGAMPQGQCRWSLYLGPFIGGQIFHADTLATLVAVVRRHRGDGMGIYFAPAPRDSQQPEGQR